MNGIISYIIPIESYSKYIAKDTKKLTVTHDNRFPQIVEIVDQVIKTIRLSH